MTDPTTLQQAQSNQAFGNQISAQYLPVPTVAFGPSFGSWIEGWLKPVMVVFCCGLVMLEALMFFVFSMIYAVHFLPGAQ